MLRSRFAFHSWQTPHALERCIAGTKARRASERAELVDLLWDSKPKKRSLDDAASVALPYLRQRARFVALKKRVGQENVSELRGVKMQRGRVRQSGVRFRVCEFSVGEWIASFQDAPPPHSGPPQPNCTALGL